MLGATVAQLLLAPLRSSARTAEVGIHSSRGDSSAEVKGQRQHHAIHVSACTGHCGAADAGAVAQQRTHCRGCKHCTSVQQAAAQADTQRGLRSARLQALAGCPVIIRPHRSCL